MERISRFRAQLLLMLFLLLLVFFGFTMFNLQVIETEGKIVKGNTQIQTVPGCVYTENGLSTTMWPRPKQEIVELTIPVPEQLPRWENFYENILDVLEGKATQMVTHDQIRRSMKVVMAALESSRAKQTIHL